MDFAQLTLQLRALGVQPIDTLRASLYIDYLQDAQTFFHTTLNAQAPNGIGTQAYAFVRRALQSPKLLKELADILDLYVGPAVDADLTRVLRNGSPQERTYTYRQFFENTILDANAQTYGNNLAAFRTRYPISADALVGLSRNFKNNVREACERVYADRALLRSMYSDLYQNFAILGLARIKSSGSDFHRGGHQVLILTFDVVETVNYRWPRGPLPTRRQHKVVYKPADIEADCLIVGDTATVNRVLNPVNFMQASLFEIYNARLQAMKTTNFAFTGAPQPLSTYRMLPRNFISAVGNPNPLPVRQAYGYIQYLNNDVTGFLAGIFGYYPFANSDFLIFYSEDEASIKRDFYQQEGALSAVAGTFSLKDLHVENVRVMSRWPYLIDLEICLTSEVTSIENTSLLDNLGGITGINVPAQDYEWGVTNPGVAGNAQLSQNFKNEIKQNRLWHAEKSGQRQLIPIDLPNLLRGFDDGMEVLRAAQQNGDFAAWFTRLHNVLVRVLPYATKIFKAHSDQIFVDAVMISQGNNVPPPQSQAQTDSNLEEFITDEYGKFGIAANNAALPNFVVLTSAEAGDDYMHLDIPIYNHRIGTTDIVNSRGDTVPIPATVNILGGHPPQPPAQPAPVTGNAGVLNRNTFFAAPPMANVVQQGQVAILAGQQAFAARVDQLSTSINDYFGQNNSHSLQTVVPIRSEEGAL